MKFISFQRYYLDKYFSQLDFYGKVLDVGGKKGNKRGYFRPPLESVESWEYLNIDKKVNPDYLCSADNIPVEEDHFDMVVLKEVLEHVKMPVAVLKEINRVLKREGRLILTMPFLYPIHPDPDDFQRWTAQKIELELKSSGFIIEKLEPMGGLFSVIYDLILVSLGLASKNSGAFKNRVIRNYIMPVFVKVCLRFDKVYKYKKNHITTGYFVIAGKQ